MLKLYAGFIQADSQKSLVSIPYAQLANSYEEAIGLGTLETRKYFPKEDNTRNWFGFTCCLVEVSKNLIDQVKD